MGRLRIPDGYRIRDMEKKFVFCCENIYRSFFYYLKPFLFTYFIDGVVGLLLYMLRFGYFTPSFLSLYFCR